MNLVSKFKKIFKRSIFRVLTSPGINQLGSRLARTYPGLLKPALGKSSFPYVGILTWEPVPGQTVKMYSDGTDVIVTSLYLAGEYEPEVTRVWLQLLKPGMKVLDIGAHTGYFALLAAMCCEQTQVLAIEPVPRVLTYLYRNLALNAVQNRVMVFAGGASDHQGRDTFYQVEAITLPCSSSENKGFREHKAITTPIQVELMPVDDLLAQIGMPQVDLVKLDTESTEPLVVAGMLKTLQHARPLMICEILSDQAGQALQALLTPWDYRYFSLTAQGLVQQETLRALPGITNFAFIPAEKLAQLDTSLYAQNSLK